MSIRFAIFLLLIGTCQAEEECAFIRKLRDFSASLSKVKSLQIKWRETSYQDEARTKEFEVSDYTYLEKNNLRKFIVSEGRKPNAPSNKTDFKFFYVFNSGKWISYSHMEDTLMVATKAPDTLPRIPFFPPAFYDILAGHNFSEVSLSRTGNGSICDSINGLLKSAVAFEKAGWDVEYKIKCPFGDPYHFTYRYPRGDIWESIIIVSDKKNIIDQPVKWYDYKFKKYELSSDGNGRANVAIELPRRFLSFSDSSGSPNEIKYFSTEITELSLNPEIDEEEFEVDYANAKIVIDGDKGKIIK